MLISLQVEMLQDAEEPPAALPDMLLMAFNMQLPAADADPVEANSSAAVKLCQLLEQAESIDWKQWVAKQLDADLAGSLFLAAAARADLDALRFLDSFEPSIVTAALSAAMGEAVQQQNSCMLEYLCGLSSAKSCDAGQLAAVLLAAVRAGYEEGVDEICAIEGLLQRLPAAHVSDLLLAMMQASTCYAEVVDVL
jgi:hypothetical protein